MEGFNSMADKLKDIVIKEAEMDTNLDTLRFRTKTEFIERDNGSLPNNWIIGIDIGYSSVKVESHNIIASFPSYAKKVTDDFSFAMDVPDDAIFYKDHKTNEMWLIGRTAQNLIERGDTSDSLTALYGRERYNNPMFKAYSAVGLAVGMRTNKYGSPDGKKITIQTGLPECYMNIDDMLLIDSLAGSYDFEIRIGKAPWEKFNFTIDAADINIISQPKGSLFSVCFDNNGNGVADAESIMENSLIFDPGFGTLDIFPILGGTVKHGETFDDLGMRRVFEETSKRILSEYKQNIPVPAMQKYLETGFISCYDRRNPFKSEDLPFNHFLNECNVKICEEALERMVDVIPVYEYKHFIITGGTGDAWNACIRNKLKGFKSLQIIDGNRNDKTLSSVYSNVRGYFLFRKMLTAKANS